MSADHAFSGSVPENYNRFLVPMIFEDYAQELASRVNVPAASAILETACGTGVTTRHLLGRMPEDTTLVATDLQIPMIDFTGASLTDTRLTLEATDANELPYEDASFDAVASSFGVMFFDRERAYRETARVLRPGGAFVTSIWGSHEHNHFARLTYETLRELFPADPPAFLAIPYAYSDLNAIKQELEQAGFDEIEILVQTRSCTCPRASDVPNGFMRGSPAIHEVLEQTDDVDAVADAIERAITERYGATDCHTSMQAYIVTARAPSPRSSPNR